MSDPAQLRDSTQIVLPPETPAEVRAELAEAFVLTIREEGGSYRVIGSPVEIDRASEYLVRQGIPIA